jgi:hypothetical protein
MTPREFDALMVGLREYREEERRAQQQAISQSTGRKSIGGQTIHNP